MQQYLTPSKKTTTMTSKKSTIMCFYLSILSPSHHLHSTCTNCPFSLVVQIEFILNYYLWIHPNPIPKLQHTLLPQKCCELRSVLQLLSFSNVSPWDSHLGLLRNLGCIICIASEVNAWYNGSIMVKNALPISPHKFF
jgi:hypothetical protein